MASGICGSLPICRVALLDSSSAPKRQNPHARASTTATLRWKLGACELATRLAALGEGAKQYPAYATAHALLNKTFRKERVAQRASILQSAAWLIDVLEQMTMAL